MGSRISINLSEFLLNEYAELHLTNHRSAADYPDSDEEQSDVAVEALARVNFRGFGRDNVEYTFDVDSSEGEILLSRDFNYFRYEDGSDEKELLFWLYNAGICFTVTH